MSICNGRGFWYESELTTHRIALIKHVLGLLKGGHVFTRAVPLVGTVMLSLSVARCGLQAIKQWMWPGEISPALKIPPSHAYFSFTFTHTLFGSEIFFFSGHCRPVLHSCGGDSTAKTIKTWNVEYIVWSPNIASRENLQFWARRQSFFVVAVVLFFFLLHVFNPSTAMRYIPIRRPTAKPGFNFPHSSHSAPPHPCFNEVQIVNTCDLHLELRTSRPDRSNEVTLFIASTFPTKLREFLI